MSERDENIKAISKGRTYGVKQWHFVPIKKLVVDDRDTDSYFGSVLYDNNGYEFGSAIKVRDWVFVLERMTETFRLALAPNNSPDVWVIGAFHNNEHYSFAPVVSQDQNTRTGLMVDYVIKWFWPFLHPEVFDSLESSTSKSGNVELKWVLESIQKK